MEPPTSEGYLKEVQKRKDRQSSLLDRYQPVMESLDQGVLEIGCGHGHWLTSYASQNFDQCCVGIDLMKHRVDKSAKKANKNELTNLHFIQAEAIEFIELIPERTSLAAVVVLFPDPWPKKRHFRRRLIQPDFLDLLASRMNVGGKLYFRTDHNGYFNWTAEHFTEHPLWTLDSELVWPMERSTYFQEIKGPYQSLSTTCIQKSAK